MCSVCVQIDNMENTSRKFKIAKNHRYFNYIVNMTDTPSLVFIQLPLCAGEDEKSQNQNRKPPIHDQHYDPCAVAPNGPRCLSLSIPP